MSAAQTLALLRSLTALGFDARPLGGRGLLVLRGECTIIVLSNPAGRAQPGLPLFEATLIVTSGKAEPALSQCPVTKPKLMNIGAPWSLRLLSRALSYPPPSPKKPDRCCNEACAFDANLKESLGQLRHLRLGIFATFGIGARISSGGVGLEDLGRVGALLREDLQRLGAEDGFCPLLLDTHPAARVRRSIAAALSLASREDPSSAEIRELARLVRDYFLDLDNSRRINEPPRLRDQ